MRKKQPIPGLNMNLDKSAEIYYYPGDHVSTAIAMEPGAQYGNPIGDFYTVACQGKCMGDDMLTFGSLRQLEEFRDAISIYVDSQKMLKKHNIRRRNH